jgi:hypothetical protein
MHFTARWASNCPSGSSARAAAVYRKYAAQPLRHTDTPLIATVTPAFKPLTCGNGRFPAPWEVAMIAGGTAGAFHR